MAVSFFLRTQFEELAYNNLYPISKAKHDSFLFFGIKTEGVKVELSVVFSAEHLLFF